jgi:hypothetical protein
MKTVIVESPFAGRVEVNQVYAKLAIRDCLRRGEAPFASHLLYTLDGVLDDTDPVERALGIEAGLAIGAKLDATVVYTDYGVTPGMRQGIDAAERAGRPIEYRSLVLGDEIATTLMKNGDKRS